MAGQMAAQSLLLPLLSFVGGLAGGIFGGYISKRGEIRAVHAELEKVVEQNKKITAATEEIKANVSTRSWARDIRKDTAFDAMRKLARMQSRMGRVGVAYMTLDGTNKQEREEEGARFMEAYQEIEQATIIVEIGCGSEVADMCSEILKMSMNFISFVNIGKTLEALQELLTCNQKTKELIVLIREKIGIELGN